MTSNKKRLLILLTMLRSLPAIKTLRRLLIVHRHLTSQELTSHGVGMAVMCFASRKSRLSCATGTGGGVSAFVQLRSCNELWKPCRTHPTLVCLTLFQTLVQIPTVTDLPGEWDAEFASMMKLGTDKTKTDKNSSRATSPAMWLVSQRWQRKPEAREYSHNNSSFCYFPEKTPRGVNGMAGGITSL